MTPRRKSPLVLPPQTPGELLRLLAASVRAGDDQVRVSAASFGTTKTPEGGPSPDDLIDALSEHLDAVVPATPPSERSSRDRWLQMVEGLELAREGASALPARRHRWARRCAGLLEEAVAKRTEAVGRMDRAWLHARVAAARSAELGREIRPWNAIRPAVASGGFGNDPDVREQAVDAWLNDLLHPDDEAELRRLVLDAGPWREAYRRALAARLTELEIPGGDPALDLEGVTRIGRFTMPHLGPGAVLEVLRVDDGTVWNRTGRPSIRLPLSAAACRIEDDPVIGPLEVRLRPVEADPLHEGWRAVCALRRLSDGEGSDEDANRVALAAVALLRSPPWKNALARAAEAFRLGNESKSEELLDWVRHAFEARVLLDAVADRLMSESLVEQLEILDEELREVGDAVFLLSDEEYEDLVADVVIDRRAWWRRREALDRNVPDAELDRLLARVARVAADERVADEVRRSTTVSKELEVRRPQVAISSGAEAARVDEAARPFAAARRAFRRAKTIDNGSLPLPPPPRRGDRPVGPRLGCCAPEDAAQALRGLAEAVPQLRRGRYEKALRVLEELPCPWLRADVREALDEVQRALSGSGDEWMADGLRATIGPSPGRVPVLVYVPDNQSAVVFELRIRLQDGPGDPWGGASALRRAARDAIRAAHRIAGSLTKSGCPVRAFQEHAFSLIGPEGRLEIEGDSLALPAVLAFVSLWTGRALGADLAASGGVAAGSGGGAVGEGAVEVLRPVGHIREKAEALASWASGSARCRLLVHPDNAEQVVSESVRVVPVKSWREAADAAGLLEPLAGLSCVFEGLETAELRRLLQAMVACVREQRIADYEVFGPDPWLVLGDNMRSLLRWLVEQRRVVLDEIAEAAAYAALALTYGGDLDGATEVLRMLDGVDPSALSLAPRVFLRIVRLAQLIGQDAWAECNRLSKILERETGRLPGPDHRRLGGMALGTRGRALMHQGKTDRAIPLLRQAVRHHERYPEVRHEAPRSRVYLAMALRLAGQLRKSVEQLDLARRHLQRPEYRESTICPRTTLMFVSYERARTLLAMAMVRRDRDPRAARRFLRQASASAEEARKLAREVAWPPLPGLLRTQVWIYRAMGETEKAEETLRQLEARVGARPLPRERRILEEARGPFRTDGEVF